MTWFAAHMVCYVKFLDGNQDKFPLWENIVLLEAISVDEAHTKADHIGREVYNSDGDDETVDFTWEDRPARWIYAGHRKLVECRTTSYVPVSPSNDVNTPVDGTEITYSQFEVSTKEELDHLLKGDPVAVLYES